jgi:hypothetical protein
MIDCYWPSPFECSPRAKPCQPTFIEIPDV